MTGTVDKREFAVAEVSVSPARGDGALNFVSMSPTCGTYEEARTIFDRVSLRGIKLIVTRSGDAEWEPA